MTQRDTFVSDLCKEFEIERVTARMNQAHRAVRSGHMRMIKSGRDRAVGVEQNRPRIAHRR
jgi:hypothetical protein